METSGPTSGIPQLPNTTTRVTALQLQVGQQLQAVVLDNTANRILLSLGYRQVSAESSLPFQRGPMQAQIHLHGDRVSTYFWATQAETPCRCYANICTSCAARPTARYTAAGKCTTGRRAF